eukprot:5304385-Amphidinium_carterae.1
MRQETAECKLLSTAEFSTKLTLMTTCMARKHSLATCTSLQSGWDYLAQLTERMGNGEQARLHM